jgi:hypothetical protein
MLSKSSSQLTSRYLEKEPYDWMRRYNESENSEGYYPFNEGFPEFEASKIFMTKWKDVQEIIDLFKKNQEDELDTISAQMKAINLPNGQEKSNVSDLDVKSSSSESVKNTIGAGSVDGQPKASLNGDGQSLDYSDPSSDSSYSSGADNPSNISNVLLSTGSVKDFIRSYISTYNYAAYKLTARHQGDSSRRGRKDGLRRVDDQTLQTIFDKWAEEFLNLVDSQKTPIIKHRPDSFIGKMGRCLKRISHIFLHGVGSQCMFKSNFLNRYLTEYLFAFMAIVKYFDLQETKNVDELEKMFLQFIVLYYPEGKVEKVLIKHKEDSDLPDSFYTDLLNQLKCRSKTSIDWFESLLYENCMFRLFVETPFSGEINMTSAQKAKFMYFYQRVHK